MPTVGSIVGGAFRHLFASLGAVAIWCVVYIAITTALGLWIQHQMAPFIEQMQAQLHNVAAAKGSVSQPPSFPTGFVELSFLFDIALLAVMAVLLAAVFRSVLYPAESRAAFLRFGNDEVCLIGLIILLGIGSIIGGILLMIPAAIVASIALVTLSNNMVASGIVVFGLVLGFYSLIFFIFTRLSVAGPLTLIRGKIVVGEAWRLSRGYGWTLFWSYFIIGVLLMLVLGLAMWAAWGSTFSRMMQHMNDQQAMQQIMIENSQMSPLRIPMMVVMGLIGMIGLALQGSATAIATAELLRVQPQH